MATSTTPAAAGAPAPRPRTASLFVDASGSVLFVDAGEDAAAFLSSLLATARELLREENPASAADGCLGNLVAAEAILPPAAVATSTTTTATSISRAPPPPASPASAPWVPKGMGIMARRLFRCGHLGCPCSDVASRSPSSACPCASPLCARAAGTRDTELHFLEACFYRRPDGSAASTGRGAGRSGDAFYRCRARDERRGRDVFPCRFRVTDERGVECPLCGGRTSVLVKCAEAGDNGENSSVSARPDAGRGGEAGGPATSYVVMDDLTVRPVAAGLRGAALLSALGVAADPADVRELTVPFGFKEGLSVLLAALRSNTALTDFFVPAAGRPAWRRRHL